MLARLQVVILLGPLVETQGWWLRRMLTFTTNRLINRPNRPRCKALAKYCKDIGYEWPDKEVEPEPEQEQEQNADDALEECEEGAEACESEGEFEDDVEVEDAKTDPPAKPCAEQRGTDGPELLPEPGVPVPEAEGKDVAPTEPPPEASPKKPDAAQDPEQQLGGVAEPVASEPPVQPIISDAAEKVDPPHQDGPLSPSGLIHTPEPRPTVGVAETPSPGPVSWMRASCCSSA